MKRKLQVFFENVFAILLAIVTLFGLVGACRWFVEFVCYSWNISGEFLYNIVFLFFGVN